MNAFNDHVIVKISKNTGLAQIVKKSCPFNIGNGEVWHYLAVKKQFSALLRGILLFELPSFFCNKKQTICSKTKGLWPCFSNEIFLNYNVLFG